MVLMAGSGHIAYRWASRTGCSGACGGRDRDGGVRRREDVSKALADYLVFSPEVELPKAGSSALSRHDG